MRKLYLLLVLFGTIVFAQNTQADTEPSYELWQDSNFVKAYLVVADPGTKIYSIFGHACLRMVCDTFDMDYCYSYECVDVPHITWHYITNTLNMGMIATPTKEYLQQYADENRGATEYELLLSTDAKRHLWQVLDEKIMEGHKLPYDFIKRGCAYSCIPIMEKTLRKTQMCYPQTANCVKQTRRDAMYEFAHNNTPWQLLIFNTIAGTDIDKLQIGKKNIILPTQLAEFWQQTTIDGKPLLDNKAHILIPAGKSLSKPLITPTLVAFLILLISIASWRITIPFWDYATLGIVTILGTLEVYLIFFSNLPCTQWNWLIIPFNIVPAIVWRWRQYWSTPYAIIVILWAIAMIVIPHHLTDNAYSILALAWSIVLLKDNKHLQKFRRN